MSVTAQRLSVLCMIYAQGMTLSYVIKGKNAEEQTTIPFEPPLSGYEEVKPRLLQMKLEAEQGLGMVRRPPITTFELPLNAGITLIPLLLLYYVTISDPMATSSLYYLGTWIRNALGGTPTLRFIWGIVFVLHSLETLYTVSLCRRHATGLFNGAKWTLSVLAFGFPALMRLRKLIIKARIDSISKIH